MYIDLAGLSGCLFIREVRYGGHRKQVGYHVQRTKTCSETKDTDNPKIITQVEINLANSPDVQTVVPGIERLEEAGLKPEILLTDNGYASDDNHQELKKRNVDHVCPPAGELPNGFGVIDFAIEEDGERIKHCPLGKPCLANKVNAAKKATASITLSKKRQDDSQPMELLVNSLAHPARYQH